VVHFAVATFSCIAKDCGRMEIDTSVRRSESSTCSWLFTSYLDFSIQQNLTAIASNANARFRNVGVPPAWLRTCRAALWPSHLRGTRFRFRTNENQADKQMHLSS
jgi:hypothetical protein